MKHEGSSSTWARLRRSWPLAGSLLLGVGCGTGEGAVQRPQPTFVPPNPLPGDDRGFVIGSFVHTFYWMEFEDDYPGRADTDLAGTDCRPVARVPEAFAQRVCVEGSGRLSSGALLNLSGECACGYPCRETDASVCFFPVTDRSADWGYGSDGNPLIPLRSLAIEQRVVAHGTVLYIPEWDGVTIPASPRGLGGFTHDGCFRADDIGYGVQGRHYDIYAGTSALWMTLEQVLPTDSSTTVYRDPPRCAGKVL
jgi:3D (Asp-Asp-Asp) domain-containing protein